MAGTSTTTALNLNLVAGDCWARRQLPSGIKDISVVSRLSKSLTLVRVLFIYTLAIPQLDGRSLHNHSLDPQSDCERLVASTPGMQWNKVHPSRIRTHEIAVFCARYNRYQAGDTLLDGRYLHNLWTDFDSVSGRLLGLTPAFQQYKVRLGHIKAQEAAVFCREDLDSSPGNILLDGRLLHSQWTDFAAPCGGLLGTMPASQQYKVRLCRIKT